MLNRYLLTPLAALALLATTALPAQAQTGGVRIGTAGTPDASAVLDVSPDPAKPQGLLLPRLTLAQRQAMAAPAVGLLVYQTDGAQPGLWYNQASGGWTFLSSVGPAGPTGATGPQGPAATPTYVPDPALSMAPVTTLTPSNSTYTANSLSYPNHSITIQTTHFTAIAIYRNTAYLLGDITGMDNSSTLAGQQVSDNGIYKLDLTTMVFSQLKLGQAQNIPAGGSGAYGTGDGLAVSDDGSTVYLLSRGSTVTSYNVGTGAASQLANGFVNAQGIAYYSGYLYVADTGTNCIRKLSATNNGSGSGNGTLFAGSATVVAGAADGTGSQARFNAPSGIANRLNGTSPTGYFFVTDTNNHRIRQVGGTSVTVSTIAGTTAGYLDGGASTSSPTAAQFNGPVGITYSSASDAVYVTDVNNNCVRKIEFPNNTTQKVSTVAGSGMVGLANGAGYKARFNGLTGIAGVPNTNTILILDTGNSAIRQLIP